jgi:hypothetical protein
MQLQVVEKKIKDLELRLEAYSLEAHNVMLPMLKKINNREAVRKTREKEEDEEDTAIPLNNPMFKT